MAQTKQQESTHIPGGEKITMAMGGSNTRNTGKAVTNSSDSPFSEEWSRIQTRLRAQVGEDHYTSWLKGMALEEIIADTAYLSVSTQFLRNWIQKNYSDLVLELLQEEVSEVEAINLAVRGHIKNTEKRKLAQKQAAAALPAPVKMSGTGDAKIMRGMGDYESPNGGAALDPKYTFNTFCVGPANSLAFKAMKAVAQGDMNVTFNSLYIHAKVGLGKTHLLQAIAWEGMRSCNGRRIMYLTSERFMQKLRDGFANKSIAEVKERLRDIDVLLIDDIQFLNGDKFCLEFSHLVIAMIEAGKQVVVTADRPSTELKNLDDRVLSRFRGGIGFELEGPDKELRRNILNTRLATLKHVDPNISLPTPVVEYVVSAISTNGRDLEGALNRLVTHQNLTGTTVTLESAKLVLKDLVQSDEPRKVMIEDIQRQVATHFNISKADLISQRRTRAIVRPRQIAMFLCKMMTPRSLPEIGKRFGGRDHTTVIHAVQKVEELMSADTTFKDDVELLRQLLLD